MQKIKKYFPESLNPDVSRMVKGKLSELRDQGAELVPITSCLFI